MSRVAVPLDDDERGREMGRHPGAGAGQDKEQDREPDEGRNRLPHGRGVGR